jgi:DNA (cytosine-5)-methyltransferase 1
MFPDNHTEGVTNTKRAFLMGNALVVGIVNKLGNIILEELNQTNKIKKEFCEVI